MRLVLLLLVLALSSSCVSAAEQRARREGAREAHEDLAAGHVVLRTWSSRFRELGFIDPGTGLPTEDHSERCGTCAGAYFESRHAAYNDVVLAALTRGELAPHVLSSKVRNRADAEAEFGRARVDVWDPTTGACGPDRGPYRMVLRQSGRLPWERLHALEVATGRIQPLATGSTLPAGAELAFADAGTTLLARLADGSIIAWDLPSGHAIQRLAPGAATASER